MIKVFPSLDFQYRAPINTPIQFIHEMQDLGVRMSSNLSFDPQVDKVLVTANQMTGWDLRTFGTRHRDMRLQLLTSLVQPQLCYW